LFCEDIKELLLFLDERSGEIQTPNCKNYRSSIGNSATRQRHGGLRAGNGPRIASQFAKTLADASELRIARERSGFAKLGVDRRGALDVRGNKLRLGEDADAIFMCELIRAYWARALLPSLAARVSRTVRACSYQARAASS
jgi:hypothetical protein